MFIRLTTGFIIASLLQALIVMFGEKTGITELGAQFDFMQLLNHILTGILAGFILYFIMTRFSMIKELNMYIVGVIYGFILWPFVLGIASSQGKVNSPLDLDVFTIIWTLVAFATYGIVATYTIKRYVD